MGDYGERCYRMRRNLLYVGIAAAVGYSIIGAVSAACSWWNVDGSFARPELGALIFGLFWSCWALLGLWLVWVYHRYRLRVDQSGVEQVGGIRTRQLRFSDVLSARWRGSRYGGVVLRAPGVRLVIDFGDFAASDRSELIALLHDALAQGVQEGWERFESHVVAPRAAPRQLRVVRLILAAMLLSFAVFFGYTWAAGFGGDHLGLAVVNALAGLAMLWTLRSKRGMRPVGSS
jgi:hypothetical protein